MSYGIDSVDLIFEEMKEKFAKTAHNFSTELKSMRAGRANPHILDKITVDYYGTCLLYTSDAADDRIV